MPNVSLQTIKTKGHSETKMLFLYLFYSSRGGTNRSKIMTLLKNRPLNANQMSTELRLDYKVIAHHLKVLEKNNIIEKIGDRYVTCYFASSLFKTNQQIFDEINNKLR